MKTVTLWNPRGGVSKQWTGVSSVTTVHQDGVVRAEFQTERGKWVKLYPGGFAMVVEDE